MYQTSQIDMTKKTTKLQANTATLLTLLPRVDQKEHIDNISQDTKLVWCPLQLGVLSDRQTRPPVIRSC
jgi:hypothetical protein